MTKARTLADNYAADINQVSAGVGITGGGTSGTVTITNDMATSINAKGDLVVGTANDTYSRLAVASTAGYVLTVDSAEATGVKWAAAATSSGPAFRAYSSSTQNVNASTWTEITFGSETFDTDNCFASSRFTPNKAGYYLINAKLYAYQDSAQKAYGAVYKNGSSLFDLGGSVPDNESWKELYASGSDIVYMNGTTDYVSVYGYLASTTISRYFGGASANTFFSGTWIRS